MVFVFVLTGCKPTEKNYQAAYEAARKKKMAEAAEDPDMVLPAGALQKLDAPRKVDVGDEKLNIKHVFIKYAGKDEAPLIKRYNAAVSRYKMPTNAIAQTEDLKARKLDAFPVEGSDGFFYVIGGSFDTLEEVAEFAKKYKKSYKPSQMIGLDGELLIIEK